MKHSSKEPVRTHTDNTHTILSVQDCISDLKDWMTDYKLQLNEDKTEGLLFNSSKLHDPPTSLSICQTTVTFSESVRNLSFYINKGLSMKEHVDFICKTAFFELCCLSTMQHYLSVDPTKTLVVLLVRSRIDDCNFLLAGLPLSLISKLQRIQNCAAHLVVHASSSVHITSILKQLHWLPIKTRISYKIACLCFNAINYSTPAYLSDLLHLYSPSRSLRSSADTCLLKLPPYKCKTKGDRAFSYSGPSVWNSLPLHIRNDMTLDTFKSALKNHLFNVQDFD